MRLSEGQVMDWTKGTTPYMDERFKEGYVPVQQVPTIHHDVGPEPELPEEGESQFSNCTIPHFPVYPGTPLVPQIPSPFQPLPPVSLPSLPPTDYSSIVWEKVTARKEALEMMDDKTPEMKATIKALEWVLDTIIKVKTTC